jgi:hypothetical protein
MRQSQKLKVLLKIRGTTENKFTWNSDARRLLRRHGTARQLPESLHLVT